MIRFRQSLEQRQELSAPTSGGLTSSYFPKLGEYLNSHPAKLQAITELMQADTSGVKWQSAIDFWLCSQYPEYTEACQDYYTAVANEREGSDFLAVQKILNETKPEGAVEKDLIEQALIESIETP